MEFQGHISFPGLKESISAKLDPKTGATSAQKIIGLLFVREHDPLVEKKLLPHRDYLHVRSGDNVDFYWIGWGTIFDDTPGSLSQGWRVAFDSKRFNATREDVERYTSWKYGGGAELFLFAAHWDLEKNQAVLDLSNCISVDLRSIERDGVDPDIFFEQIFSFADRYKGDSPIVDLFFDKAKRSTSSSAFWLILQSILPKRSVDDIERLSKFAVKDYSLTEKENPTKLGPPTTSVFSGQY